MRATYRCSLGARAEAKVDYYGASGRVRGNVLYQVSVPDRVRFGVYSPFGVMLSSLTSDGQRFSMFDLEHKEFLEGPASACNVARFTRVPIPPHALVQLLRGEAPVLVHEPENATIAWESGYAVRIRGTRQAEQTLLLEPWGPDFHLPWQRQRVIVREVEVSQAGALLYRAELGEHQAAHTAPPGRDPDGLEPDLPPSGPPCDAPVPRVLMLEAPYADQDLAIRVKTVVHNPPLPGTAYVQLAPAGVRHRHAECSD